MLIVNYKLLKSKHCYLFQKHSSLHEKLEIVMQQILGQPWLSFVWETSMSKRESSEIRFCNFDSNLHMVGGFSLMGQGIRRSSALAKHCLVLSLSLPIKIPPLVECPTKFLSPSTKYQFPRFNVIKTAYLTFYLLSLLLYHF